MKIRVHPSLILWLSVLFYLSPCLVLPFLGAAAFHEMGHVLMLRKLGKPPECLTLTFSGAQMQVPSMSYQEERLSAAAGPMFSFLLGLIWPIIPATALYSISLGLVNLFPIPGLDGYRILRTTLHLKLSQEKAEKCVSTLSVIFSVFLTLTASYYAAYYDLGFWLVLLSGVLLIRCFGGRHIMD